MLKLGKIARHVRESKGISQRAAAAELGISVVHLCNVENDKSTPSPDLLDRFRKTWDVDLYILSWCMQGNVNRLPAAARKPAIALANYWKKKYGLVDDSNEAPDASCSTFEM